MSRETHFARLFFVYKYGDQNAYAPTYCAIITVRRHFEISRNQTVVPRSKQSQEKPLKPPPCLSNAVSDISNTIPLIWKRLEIFYCLDKTYVQIVRPVRAPYSQN